MSHKIINKYKNHEIKESMMAILYFLPFGILFILFIIVPIVMAVGLSFTNYNVINNPVFVGFRNYVYMFTEDDVFIKAFTNTFAFAVFSGAIGYFASFSVAWIIDNLKFKMFFALAFYAPSITGSIAMSVIWLNFFSPDANGFLNNWLLQLGVINQPILWTQSPDMILPIVVVVSVWMGMGNGFLGFLAGFQNMNKEIFEAADIDGIKNNFQRLIYVIFPQMKPMLLFGAVTTVVGAFAAYDVPLTLAGSPGPNNAGLTIVGDINDYAFTRLDFGYASTIAVILFILIFALGRILFKILGSEDE